jgi:hypothetical protein
MDSEEKMEVLEEDESEQMRAVERGMLRRDELFSLRS